MDSTGTIFDLRGRGLTLESREDAQQYLDEISTPSAITEIHLSGNTIGIGAAEAIGEALKEMNSLRVANFSDIFTRRSIAEIPKSLESLLTPLLHTHTLRSLDLSGNAFGERVAPVLVPLLTTNRSIHTLNLNNQGLGPAAGTILADALHKSALLSAENKEEPQLRVLIIGRNRLEDSAHAWGRAFSVHTNLEGVHMPQNGIKADGFGAIVKGLAQAKALRHLNLQDNWGKKEDMDSWPHLTSALSSWPSLAFLNIADCCLTPESFSPMLEQLAEGNHASLHTLVLDNSDLNSETYEQMRGVVKDNLPALKTLSLALNEDLEDDEYVDEMVKALEGRGGEVILDDEVEGERWSLPTYLEPVAVKPTPAAEPAQEITKVEEKKDTSAEDELEAALAGLSLGK
ncbi:Leucine-rich repeat domain superfamily protein [Pleurotus pulmonarius]